MKKKITVETAEKIIKEKGKKDLEEAEKEIKAILNKYGVMFILVPDVIINGQRPKLILQKVRR